MKITIVMGSGLTLSGGDRVIATYAHHLLQRGHEVHVVSRPKGAPKRLGDRLRTLIKGSPSHPIYKSDPKFFDELSIPYRFLDRYRPVTDRDVPDADVVIATWWETAEWVANLSPKKGAKAYFIQHHEAFDYMPLEQVRASYRLPLHKIVIARWLVDLMAEEYGDRTVSYVPNSVDTARFTVPPRSKQPVPTVGMLYNPTPWKGTDICLEAYKLAAQQIPNLQLVALGASDPIAELPIPPSTDYCQRPAQDTLKDVYAKCDAWLFGSRLEGFGLPILEAMACRTPVIGTPTGAAPELLGDGAGRLVESENPAAMAAAIVQICHLCEEEWRQLSDRAYNKAIQYTWDDATLQFEAALEWAIVRQTTGDLPQRPSSYWRLRFQ